MKKRVAGYIIPVLILSLLINIPNFIEIVSENSDENTTLYSGVEVSDVRYVLTYKKDYFFMITE